MGRLYPAKMLHHRFSQTIKNRAKISWTFTLLLLLLQFCAEECTDFVPHFLLEEMEICVVGILDRKQCDVTSRFSSSSCSSSPCPNGTVWSSSPWMIRNGGAAFVTKLTGQHASASSRWRITFCPSEGTPEMPHTAPDHCTGIRGNRSAGTTGRRPARHWNIPGFTHIINGICRKRCHAGQITARRLSHHTDAVRINVEAIGMCTQITNSCFHILQRCRKFASLLVRYSTDATTNP